MEHRSARFRIILKASFLLALGGLFACSVEMHEQMPGDDYEGPIVVYREVTYTYSLDGGVKGVMEAPTSMRYENGDQSFPDGMKLTFFNEEDLRTTLLADSGYIETTKKLYHMIGNVVVTREGNPKAGKPEERLETERLYSDRRRRKIYSDTAVMRVTFPPPGSPLPPDTTYGDGMTADEDFTNIVVSNPRGTFAVKGEAL